MVEMEREPTRWVLGGRRNGKTSALLEWLAGGQVRDPGHRWSRVLVVSSAQTREGLVGSRLGRRVDRRIREAGGYSLESVILTPGEDLQNALRGRWPDTEIGVDDADHLLAAFLGLARLPSMMSGSGVPARPLEVEGGRSVALDVPMSGPDMMEAAARAIGRAARRE